jgi:hypothetical protein
MLIWADKEETNKNIKYSQWPLQSSLLVQLLELSYLALKVHAAWIFSKFVIEPACGKPLPFNTTQGQPNDNFQSICCRKLDSSNDMQDQKLNLQDHD